MDAIPIADWSRFRQFLQALPYGKILPTAIYVHRDTEVCRIGHLAEILALIARRHAIGEEFNVVKFRTDEPRLSFLSYPSFFDVAHPSLEEAVAIDLCSGRSLRTAYRDSLNPPILHRKELLLAPDHPRSPDFAALSAAEELAGLYSNTAVIGFRVNWERSLAARGLTIEGHCLVGETSIKEGPPVRDVPTVGLAIDRHKTALTRYQLSRPVKTLIEYAQLSPGSSFLDYGCGLGADIRGLGELGFDASGWDPVHAPTGSRTEADVVNLGYDHCLWRRWRTTTAQRCWRRSLWAGASRIARRFRVGSMATRWLCAFSRARCHWIAAAIHVALPSGGCPGEPIWAADGKRFAFVNIASESVELWIGDAKTGEVQGPVSTRTSPLRQRYGRCRLAR